MKSSKVLFVWTKQNAGLGRIMTCGSVYDSEPYQQRNWTCAPTAYLFDCGPEQHGYQGHGRKVRLQITRRVAVCDPYGEPRPYW